jgi:hypothetical protein
MPFTPAAPGTDPATAFNHFLQFILDTGLKKLTSMSESAQITTPESNMDANSAYSQFPVDSNTKGFKRRREPNLRQWVGTRDMYKKARHHVELARWMDVNGYGVSAAARTLDWRVVAQWNQQAEAWHQLQMAMNGATPYYFPIQTNTSIQMRPNSPQTSWSVAQPSVPRAPRPMSMVQLPQDVPVQQEYTNTFPMGYFGNMGVLMQPAVQETFHADRQPARKRDRSLESREQGRSSKHGKAASPSPSQVTISEHTMDLKGVRAATRSRSHSGWPPTKLTFSKRTKSTSSPEPMDFVYTLPRPRVVIGTLCS